MRGFGGFFALQNKQRDDEATEDGHRPQRTRPVAAPSAS